MAVKFRHECKKMPEKKSEWDLYSSKIKAERKF